MQLQVTKERIENMVNHLYAHGIDSESWSEDDVYFLNIEKIAVLEKVNYMSWIKTWFPATELIEETDTIIKLLLAVE